MATNPKTATDQWETAWRGFAPGSWQSRVNVREFIQRNYLPYEGDGAFLQGATERTRVRSVPELVRVCEASGLFAAPGQPATKAPAA